MRGLADGLLARWPPDSGAGTEVAIDLVTRYAEPHRHYHDLRHLQEVLRVVDMLAAHAGDLTSVRVAAWFHDAVYDPHASDSEDRSAGLATAALPVPMGDRVGRLVRLTKDHLAPPGDADGGVLCDADLAVLGATTERYDAYAADVRREYAQVPAATFAAGRVSLLGGLLQRERLYVTPPAYESWERRARVNLAREIAALGASAGRQR